MNKIIDRIGKELLDITPAFIFFLIMFHILIVTRVLMLKQYGITPRASAIALIGALIMAKVIFIANKLPFLNQYPKKPLIWNVALKTIVFGVIALFFLMIEELLHQAHIYGSLSTAYAHFYADFIWPIFWVREIWLNVLLLFYCSAVELVKVLGADKVMSIFFGAPKR